MEGTAGAAQSPVRVLPSAGFRLDGFFLEKCPPPFVPDHEVSDEVRGGHLREAKGKGTKFLCRDGDRIALDVFLDGLDLVELAELDGKVWEAPLEHGDDALAPVDDETGEVVPGGEQDIQCLFVVHDLLRHNLLLVQVPALGAAYEDAVAASEECSVHRNKNSFWLCNHLPRRSCMSIEVLSQRLWMFPVFFAQLRVCLLVRRVLRVRLDHP